MSEVKTIRLYGKLGAKFGRVHRMAVGSVAEAVQALSSQFPGFDRYMTESKDNGMAFACFIGKRNISQEQLDAPTGSEEIRIAPIIIGSKNAGIFQIIIGVILIVIGFCISGFSFGTLTPVGAMFVGLGISMIVGGVVQMLTPVPKSPEGRDRPDANASYVFNGPVNTQAQGNPVPVLYGRLTVGSSVISAGILANQQLVLPPPRPVWGGGHLGDMIGFVVANKRYDQEYPSAN